LNLVQVEILTHNKTCSLWKNLIISWNLLVKPNILNKKLLSKIKEIALEYTFF